MSTRTYPTSGVERIMPLTEEMLRSPVESAPDTSLECEDHGVVIVNSLYAQAAR